MQTVPAQPQAIPTTVDVNTIAAQDRMIQALELRKAGKIVQLNSGSRLHPDRLVRGEGHPLAKLTEDNVRAIRAIGPEVSDGTIARQFNVWPNTIYQVRKGQTWKSIGP